MQCHLLVAFCFLRCFNNPELVPDVSHCSKLHVYITCNVPSLELDLAPLKDYRIGTLTVVSKVKGCCLTEDSMTYFGRSFSKNSNISAVCPGLRSSKATNLSTQSVAAISAVVAVVAVLLITTVVICCCKCTPLIPACCIRYNRVPE